MVPVRLFAIGLVAALGQELSERTLGLDDECATRGDCAANALQLKGASLAAEREDGNISDAGDDPSGHCGDCMMNNGEGMDNQVLGSGMRLWHYAQNCWYHCGRKAGSCPGFCGPGNACCRYRFAGPPECERVGFWPAMSYHTCVFGSVPVEPSIDEENGLTNPSSSSDKDNTGLEMKTHPAAVYMPKILSLSRPSEAPLHTFYVYRAMSENSYPMENVNAASAGGVMWYLHNEVIIFTPRKFSITRIVRFKVQYRAPQPLYDKGMNFGVRYAFDSGKCTGPGNCEKDFDKYGVFVGCNKVNEFPTTQFADAMYYPDAVWYSFPGPCYTRDYKKHSDSCVRYQPGGARPGEPSGKGDCTFSYEPKGFVTVDEVVGIPDYMTFLKSGGKEYVAGLGYGQSTCRRMPWTCDKGIHTSFWNEKHNPRYNERRVHALLNAFQKKYPDEPSLPDVPCDFNEWHFYH